MDNEFEFVGYNSKTCYGRIIFNYGEKTIITSPCILKDAHGICLTTAYEKWSKDNISWSDFPIELTDAEKDAFLEMVKSNLENRFGYLKCEFFVDNDCALEQATDASTPAAEQEVFPVLPAGGVFPKII